MTPTAPPPPSSQPQPQGQGFAIAALVLGVLSLCLPPLLIVSVVLALMVLFGKKPGQGLAIGALALSGMGAFMLMVMAAIAIPNFMRYQARAKQGECKTMLRSAMTSLQSRQAEGGDLTTLNLGELGLSEASRYVYFGGTRAGERVVGSRVKGDIDELQVRTLEQTAIGITGECPRCFLTLACAGDIDSDERLDIWSVSTGPRQTNEGELVTPGEVFHHLDDVEDDSEPQPLIFTSDDEEDADDAEEPDAVEEEQPEDVLPAPQP